VATRKKPAPRKSARPRAAKKPKARRRPILWLVKWSLVAAIWGGVALAVVVAWAAWDLPDTRALAETERRPSVVMFAADGSRLASYGDIYGAAVQAGDLPPHLRDAVVAIEDRKFYAHIGIDPWGVARALVVNVRAGRIVQGGSTLTQQLAKNLFLTPERSLKRKLQEALLALILEARYAKDQLLTIYLNRVYFGAGAYGVEAASRKFFAKSSRDVTVYEAALLAGLLRAPSRLNPQHDPQAAHRRAVTVLHAMVDAGRLDPQDADMAKVRRRDAQATEARGANRWFADWVLEQVAGYAGLSGADLVVETTLDPALQAAAEAAVAAGLMDGEGRNVSQAALVALSPDGAVRAMVGGADYGSSQFNRATQARRQPGSAFKPIVYLAALEVGATPDTVLEDAPITVEGWSPANFDGRFRGPVSLREALARSLNVPAVALMEQVGRADAIAVARRLGITAPLRAHPSLALGAAEVTPLELTAAYAAFANGGAAVQAHGIAAIRTRAGEVLYRATPAPVPVIARQHAETMNALLAAAIGWGTGRAARLDRPAAGKTGTSQDHRDAWFVGYTADLVAGVWLGNDDNAPMQGVTGGGLPAEMWARFMRAANEDLRPRTLPGVKRMPELSAAE